MRLYLGLLVIIFTSSLCVRSQANVDQEIDIEVREFFQWMTNNVELGKNGKPIAKIKQVHYLTIL